MDLDGCSEISCFQGVQCYDIPAPGIGAACDPCPVGYTGDGEKCAGRLAKTSCAHAHKHISTLAPIHLHRLSGYNLATIK